MEARDSRSAEPVADPDPQELREWCDALDGVIEAWGKEEGKLRALLARRSACPRAGATGWLGAADRDALPEYDRVR